MIVGEDPAFIFVEKPKSGSSSLALALSKLGFERSQLVGTHASLADMRKVSKNTLSSYFKFCFTRNPWDAEVSRYAFWKNGRVAQRILAGLERRPEFVAKHQCARELEFPEWLMNLPREKRGDEYAAFDAVYRFEHIQEAFNEISQKLSLGSIDLPHKNRSTRYSYQTYYNEAYRELVQHVYAHRISKFGYTFEEDPRAHLQSGK